MSTPLFPGSTATKSAPSPLGPSSNTGLNVSTLTAPIVDWLTVILPPGALKKSGCGNYHELLAWLFQLSYPMIAMGIIHDRFWQFYPQHATLVEATGLVAGKIGFAASGSVCISLSGAGCRHVPDFPGHVHDRLQDLQAKITRIDVAVDDLSGSTINVHDLNAAESRGDFINGGRKPLSQFIDDKGSGKGCTLYIGQKGHKELCIYEKGKQLGDPNSGYTRCELRMYGKHQVLDLGVLKDLGGLFAGAYPLLATFIADEVLQLERRQVVANATTEAMLRHVKQSVGTALHLVYQALGEEAFTAFVLKHVTRPGLPGRFKGFAGDLHSHVRQSLTQRANP